MSETLTARRVQRRGWKVVPGDPSGAGDFDYTYADEEETLTYRLRGAYGTYEEAAYGDVACGTLSLVGPTTVDVAGVRFTGLSYEGVDQAGRHLYFFGDTDHDGSYLVATYFQDDAHMALPLMVVPAQRVQVRRV